MGYNKNTIFELYRVRLVKQRGEPAYRRWALLVS